VCRGFASTRCPTPTAGFSASGANACSRNIPGSRSSAKSGASIPRSSRAGSKARRPGRSLLWQRLHSWISRCSTRWVQGLTEAEGRESGLLRIYQALADDFLYADPNRLVVFGDNHDTSRIHTQLGKNAARTKMAFAFLATVRGIPEFMYGSEILMQNPEPNADGRVRQDFPGGWAGDSADGTSAGPPPARDAQVICAACSMAARRSAVTAGALTQFAPGQRVRVFPPRRASS
jgi:hypothetical protein